MIDHIYEINNPFSFGETQISEDENTKYNFDDDPRYFQKNNNNKNSKNIEIKNPKKKKLQIFQFIKKGKRGRMKKVINKNSPFSSTLRKNNKLKPDNIKRKIKIFFTKALLNYVNTLYQEYKGINSNSSYEQETKEKKWLLPIDNKIITQISKKEILKWSNMTIKEYLSSNISPKFNENNYPSDYNAKKINAIYSEKNMMGLVRFLEQEKIKKMFDIYVNDIYIEDRYYKFSKLKNDINKIKNKEKNKEKNKNYNEKEDGKIEMQTESENKELNDEMEYISKIKEIAKNLLSMFDDK